MRARSRGLSFPSLSLELSPQECRQSPPSVLEKPRIVASVFLLYSYVHYISVTRRGPKVLVHIRIETPRVSRADSVCFLEFFSSVSLSTTVSCGSDTGGDASKTA